eukprot:1428430-Prymnesium_polylepis.3
MLHIGRGAIGQVERMCGTTGSDEAGKVEHNERLKVLFSVKALRRRSSARRKTSMRKGSTTRPGLSQNRWHTGGREFHSVRYGYPHSYSVARSTGLAPDPRRTQQA